MTCTAVSSGPIWIDNLDCGGDDEVLEDCRFNDWGVHNCRHSDDVSVICKPSKSACESVTFLGWKKNTVFGKP